MLALALYAGRSLAAEPAPAKPATPAAPAAPAAMPVQPLTELPYHPSLDLSAMDRSVDPCVDFYAYSCNGWRAANPLPADQSRWDVYRKATTENQQFLWGMLQTAAQAKPGRSAAEAKIGDYFAACMDESTAAKRGVLALAPDVTAINSMKSIADLPTVLAPIHLAGGYFPFGFGSNPDLKDSHHVIAFAIAGGLGLPDRDYYVKDDDKSKEIRTRYVDHVEKMLLLFGEPQPAAHDAALATMRIETALAQASLTRVESRDPYNLDHAMTLDEMQKLTPSFDWHVYLKALGVKEAAAVQKLNTTEPKFFAALDALLKSESLAAWRGYLLWHLVNERAEYLPQAFADQDFAFFRQYLNGQSEQQPRWKRCVRYVDTALGDALGQVFVAKVFTPETRARALDMTERIQRTMGQRIRGLDWMSAATKQQALGKLAKMRNKIGYPNTWRDYSAVAVDRADFLGNVMRAAQFENRRELAKIGKPVDPEEWDMTPPTVNAGYEPQRNEMNFPAGILLPPMFDPKLDDAPNYGNTGATIGHELTHGFDDEGRQFDADGNLHDWWSEEDGKRFEERAKCVSDQYSQYVAVDDIKINGKLTLGEDLADLGGTILAYEAWKDAVKGKKLENQDGLTPDQRYFVGFAQWDCSNISPEAARARAMTDPHSPGRYRINGVLVNMPEFAAAFQCKPGQPMVKAGKDLCRVW